MRRALAFDNSPALSVPLRFFLNAPIFVILACALLLWAGPQALATRWTPYALALTHLLTLGVLTSAMAGALMQILPVATGISVLAPRFTATLVHALLSAGALALAAAFITGHPLLFQAALCLLAPALAWLAAACLGGYWRHRRAAARGSEDVRSAAGLALAALFATTVSGGLLAAAFAWPSGLPAPSLVDAHAAWGLSGWVGLLVVGMAYQVIPIFQATELYPRPMARWLAPGIFILLLIATAGMLAASEASHATGRAAAALILAGYAGFAGATLRLLWLRKRPKADATTLFWRTAMASLAGCGAVWLTQIATGSDYSVTLAVLFIVGFAWSAINGMLYKIIPFLLWHHTQKDLPVALGIVPKVKEIIPDHKAAGQFRAHLPALLLLTAASLWPAPFSHVAAIALAVSAAWLGWNMAGAIRLYLRVKRQIALLLIGA